MILTINPRYVKAVKNPLPIPTICPHCGFPVKLVNNSEIYGKEYGEWPYAYLCYDNNLPAKDASSDEIDEWIKSPMPCEAYVGLHPYTDIPLGTLATSEMRSARKIAKRPFISMIEQFKLTRTDAYTLLSTELNIPYSECHFGWFDVDMCKKATVAIRNIKKNLTIPT
jgi:hypothetical protein